MLYEVITQLIPYISGLAPQGFAPAGRFARVRTPEGGIMGISYATNDSPHWDVITSYSIHYTKLYESRRR